MATTSESRVLREISITQSIKMIRSYTELKRKLKSLHVHKVKEESKVTK